MKTTLIPVENLQLNMKKGPGGDYFEHDLEILAPYVRKNFKKNYKGRICFDYKLSRIVKDSIRHPVVVVESIKGYFTTTFDIGSTDETALWNVAQANKALGLTEDDVNRIIGSSMF